jgi:tetratricopeptide (TPR) repeat protein
MRSPAIFVVFLILFSSTGLRAEASTSDAQRYKICLSKAYSTPSAAYEDATIWRKEGGAGPARHCLAMALLGLRAYEEAAAQLEALAYAPDIGDEDLRIEVLEQSGEAWLQASKPEDALRVLSRALENDKTNAAVYTNRARAFMALENINAAKADLDTALRLHPDNALALRLRATVLLTQNDLGGAHRDIEAALRKEPANVDALLVRGQVREAQRLR